MLKTQLFLIKRKMGERFISRKKKFKIKKFKKIKTDSLKKILFFFYQIDIE